MKDGKTISLLQQLLETGFVAEDVKYFHQNLNTKMNYVNMVSVINNIKQSLKSLDKPFKNIEKVLDNQLSVFQKTVELEEIISPRNLEVSNRNDHAEILLRKQMHDLNACKDVDEESAGRASNVRVVNSPSHLNSGLLKKLNMLKYQPLDKKSQDTEKNDKVIETVDINSNKKSLNNNKIHFESPEYTNKHFRRQGNTYFLYFS